MIKFLCEGLTRNAMLRAESKDEIQLQGNDKKCNVEGAESKDEIPLGGTDKKCNVEALK
jgi:hypothetical protein